MTIDEDGSMAVKRKTCSESVEQREGDTCGGARRWAGRSATRAPGCAGPFLLAVRAALAAAGPPLARAIELRGLLWMQGAGKRGLRSRAERHGGWVSSQCPEASAQGRIASPQAKVGATFATD